MPRKTIDEAGNRYGRLTVLSIAGIQLQSFHTQWLCKCDCGKTKVISANRLRSGTTKSCGCLKTKAGKLAYYGTA